MKSAQFISNKTAVIAAILIIAIAIGRKLVDGNTLNEESVSPTRVAVLEHDFERLLVTAPMDVVINLSAEEWSGPIAITEPNLRWRFEPFKGYELRLAGEDTVYTFQKGAGEGHHDFGTKRPFIFRVRSLEPNNWARLTVERTR